MSARPGTALRGGASAVGLLDMPGNLPREYVTAMLDQLRRNKLIPNEV